MNQILIDFLLKCHDYLQMLFKNTLSTLHDKREAFGKRVCKGYFAIHSIKQFMRLFE